MKSLKAEGFALEDQRINNVLDVIMEVARGNYSTRVELSGKDEMFDALCAGVNMMIDDLRYSSENMKKEQEQTRNILTSIIDVIIVTDKKGSITFVNSAGIEQLGYTEQELMGISLCSLFCAEQTFADKEELLHAAGHRLANNLEKQMTRKNGTEVPVLLSISPLRSDSLEGGGYIAVARDMTESKLMEQKKEHMKHLEKMNKELDQFAYVVSHDLKAPLRAIFKLSQWIEEDLGTSLPAGVDKHLSLLRGRVSRMEGLINGILEYSRIGRTRVPSEMVNTAAMISDINDLLSLPEGFKVIVQPGMPYFRTTRVSLQQVFFNLIGNAIKYNDKPGGAVEFTAVEKKDWYEFSVADNGPGIAPEFHEKVFMIFQTLAARDKVEGTGIGLTIVKKTVEEQGGSITLESDRGKGAKFTFTWPKEME